MEGFPTGKDQWVWVNPDHVIAIETTGDTYEAIVQCVGGLSYRHRGTKQRAAKLLARRFMGYFTEDGNEATSVRPAVRHHVESEAL